MSGDENLRWRVGQVAKRLLLAGGFYKRRLRVDRFPGVAVLCYHGVTGPRPRPGDHAQPLLHVTAPVFEDHCRALRELCHPIGLDEWTAMRHDPAARPARPVLVTFDDGYRGVLRWAAPILRRWRIPAVTFVCSEWSASRRRIWADGMTGQAARVDPESVKRKSIAEQRAFAERHGTASDDDPDALLSPNEVRQLHASGVEIGGHTGAHTVLAPGTLDEQRHEIEADKRRIEEWIGRRVRAFAYPNGRPGVDFDATTVKLVEEAGYEFAFSTNPSFAREEEGSFEYSRFVVFSSVTAAELVHRLAYGWRGSSIG